MKDSSIPLDLIFNKDINEYKMEEHRNDQKPKPITFMIQNQYDKHQSNIMNVKFEIEGAGKAIQTSFIRNNEQTFFEFLNEFDHESNPYLTPNPKTKRSRKIPLIERRRRSTIHSRPSIVKKTSSIK